MLSNQQRQQREEILRRFGDLCEKVHYGQIHIEIVDGIPKNITLVHQSIRLDLTEPTEDMILKPKASQHQEGEKP